VPTLQENYFHCIAGIAYKLNRPPIYLKKKEKEKRKVLIIKK